MSAPYMALPLPPDYHTHTQLCKHASGWPTDYACAAELIGVAELACTDHCPTPDAYDLQHRMELDEFATYSTHVDAARIAADIPILFGVEADYYVGCTEFLAAWLAAQSFDVVLGSVHYLDYWALGNPAQRSLWESSDVNGVWTKYCDLLTEMIQTGLYDIVAHIDLPKRFGVRPSDDRLRELFLPVLDEIRKSGMAIEINTSGLHRPVAEMFPSAQILAWAAERMIPLTFGSDAHEPGRVGDGFEVAVPLALDAGFTEHARFSQRKITLSPLPAIASAS